MFSLFILWTKAKRIQLDVFPFLVYSLAVVRALVLKVCVHLHLCVSVCLICSAMTVTRGETEEQKIAKLHIRGFKIKVAGSRRFVMGAVKKEPHLWNILADTLRGMGHKGGERYIYSKLNKMCSRQQLRFVEINLKYEEMYFA